MHKRTTRALHFIHKWTGLITGINILILSLTGSWLVFSEEIEAAFPAERTEALATVDMAGEAPFAEAFAALSPRHPEGKPSFVHWPENDEHFAYLYFREGMEHPEYHMDTRTGEVFNHPEGGAHELNHFILHLHADLFMGPFWGPLILGVVAICFLLSTITGIIIYAPFMKGAFFGALQWGKGWRRAFADMHKLVGATSLAFNLIMAVTGILLTLGHMAVHAWVFEAVTAYASGAHPTLAEGAPAPTVDEAIAAARSAIPGIPLSSLSYPGPFQGQHHFMGFHANPESFTRFIPSASIIPVANLSAGEQLPVPLWVKAVLISVPFHFGNFAGIGVKLAWCFFGLSAGALGVSGAAISVTRWVKQWRRRNRHHAAAAPPAMKPAVETEG